MRKASLRRSAVRLLADRRGSGIVETGFLVLGVLVIFLAFIVSWPSAFMRLERTQNSLAFIGEVLTREPVWKDDMLQRIVRKAGTDLDSATDAADFGATTVTIYAAKVYRGTGTELAAALCRGVRYTRSDDTVVFLENADSSGKRALVPNLPQAMLADTSYIFVTEYTGVMRVWNFRYTIRKTTTSRPVNGVIMIQKSTDSLPIDCN